MNKLPEALREVFWAFVTEGYLVAKTSLQFTLDVADTTARVMVSAITMRTVSWLQNVRIPLDVQQAIEDLPFDGWILFMGMCTVSR